MNQIFPFLIDAKDVPVSAHVEKAIATCLVHSRVFANTIPREKLAGETLLTLTQVRWPILLKRVFDQDRAYLFDLLDIMGEQLQLAVSPSRSLDTTLSQINQGDTYESDLLQIADHLLTPYPPKYPSHLVTAAFGLPAVLGKERALEVQDWGVLLTGMQNEAILQEKETLETWVKNYRAEDFKIDQMLQAIKEKSLLRTEFLIRQRDKALLLLKEEIESLKPEIEQRLSQLNSQYQVTTDQSHEMKLRMDALQQEMLQLQSSLERYRQLQSPMQDYYAVQLSNRKEEFARMEELLHQQETGWMDELSAQSYITRRPLEMMQEQLKEAELQWKATLSRQKTLEQALIATLQEEQLKVQAAAKDLIERSFVVGANLPDEVNLELPFIVAKAGTLYQNSYYVLAPGRLKGRNQFTGFLTSLFNRLNIPYLCRDKAWEAMANALEIYLNRVDVPAKLLRMVEEHNLLENKDFWMEAIEGVNELEALALLSVKDSENLKEAVVKNWGGRGAEK
ncbi:MAG: hypothetical protein LLG09_07715 [Negativicutes bacterium]|nr:hypothetical protein [Negativicutes bacterium]